LRIKGNKNFVNFVSRFVIRRSHSHHIEELWELNLATAIFIEFGDHLINSLCFSLNTKRINCNFEFFNRSFDTSWINSSSQISIEKVKGLFNFDNLVYCDVRSHKVLGIKAHLLVIKIILSQI